MVVILRICSVNGKYSELFCLKCQKIHGTVHDFSFFKNPFNFSSFVCSRFHDCVGRKHGKGDPDDLVDSDDSDSELDIETTTSTDDEDKNKQRLYHQPETGSIGRSSSRGAGDSGTERNNNNQNSPPPPPLHPHPHHHPLHPWNGLAAAAAASAASAAGIAAHHHHHHSLQALLMPFSSQENINQFALSSRLVPMSD